MKRTVAIYARVSTEHEAQLSALENQKQYYDDIMAKHPEWILYDRYIDEGITGTSTKKRKEFLRMMQDAEDGKFNLIITREVSRFARNTVDTLQETRKLKRIGIEVWFTEDNIWTMNDEDGELRLTIMATLAQNESKKTSLRVKAGQKVSFQNAVPYGTGNILGYDRVDKQFIVNPEQAETVKIIYKLYLSGYGLRTIAYELERLGRLTATGKTVWYTGNISKILNNPFYSGTIVYRKQYVPDFLEQKRAKNNGEVEQIIVEGKHERIISKEDFSRVQEMMNKNKAHANGKQRGVRVSEDIWCKKMICCCGTQFNKRKWHNTKDGVAYAYQCYSSLRSGTVSSRLKRGLSIEGICDVPMIPQWKLNCMASEIFRMFWQDKKRVLMIANDLLEKGYDGDPNQSEKTAKAKEYAAQLTQLDRKIDNLLELRLNNLIDLERYDVKRKELIEQQEAIKRRLDVLDVGAVPDDEQLENKLKLLEFALKKNFEFNEYEIPESVIDAFVEKVVVHKDKFEWHLTLFDDDDKMMFSRIMGRRGKPQIQLDYDVDVSAEGGLTQNTLNGNERHRQLLPRQSNLIIIRQKYEPSRSNPWGLFFV